MTEEIADYDQQIKELISQIRESIQNELPNMKGKIRSEKIEYLTGRLNRLKQLMQSYKVELREISRVEAKPYEDVRTCTNSTKAKINSSLIVIHFRFLEIQRS
jgi:DNA repair ATPase RecN